MAPIPTDFVRNFFENIIGREFTFAAMDFVDSPAVWFPVLWLHVVLNPLEQ